MDDVLAHDQGVEELNRAYGQRENARVPIGFASDDSLWLSKTGHSFAELYRDPRVPLDSVRTAYEARLRFGKIERPV